MKANICDICGLLIKGNAKIFIFSIREQSVNSSAGYADTWEICPTCKGIILNILTLRKNDLLEMLNTIKKSYNMKELEK